MNKTILEENKEKIILIEISDTRPEIKEYFLEEEQSTIFNSIKGLNIVKAYNYESNLLCSYNYENDCTDLTPLLGKENYNLVIVSVNRFANECIWKITTILTISDDAKIISINGFRECTEEESNFLDNLYPEYRKGCQELTFNKTKNPITN